MRNLIVRVPSGTGIGFSGDDFQEMVDERGILRIYRGGDVVYTAKEWVDVIVAESEEDAEKYMN